MLDLSTLLQTTSEEQSPSGQQASPQIGTQDPLAEHEIAISLTLSPAATFDQRSVIGAVGIAGHAPLFIRTAVGVANIRAVVQTLYEQLTPPTTPVPRMPAATETAAQEIAIVPSEKPQQGSILDIF